MRHKPWLFLPLLLYCFMAVYVYLTNIGSPVSFPSFSCADMLMYLISPFLYFPFGLFPVLVGAVFLARGERGTMFLLAYGSRRRMFLRVVRAGILWDVLISFAYGSGILAAAVRMDKIWINWAETDSYFAAVNGQILPGVQFWQVFLAAVSVVFLFGLLIVSCLCAFLWSGAGLPGGALCVMAAWTVLMGLYASVPVVNRQFQGYNIWLFHMNPVGKMIWLCFCICLLAVSCWRMICKKEF